VRVRYGTGVRVACRAAAAVGTDGMDLVSGVTGARSASIRGPAVCRQWPAHRGLRLRRQDHHGPAARHPRCRHRGAAGTAATTCWRSNPTACSSPTAGRPRRPTWPDGRGGRSGRSRAGLRHLSRHQILATALEVRPTSCLRAPRCQPSVQRLETGVVEITSQNHNYAVAAGSIPDAETTHVNLNDGVIEGFRSLTRRPSRCSTTRSGSRPHDARYLFGAFRDLMLAHPTRSTGARVR